MKITEVRIFPAEGKDGKLKAFASMTFDEGFVVRNIKIIQGNNGLFVAMPSRRAMEPCQKCRFKNAAGSRYCNQCGEKIVQQPVQRGDEHETRGDHMDIAHPVTRECREYIQKEILDAYNRQSGQKHPANKRRTEEKAPEQSAETNEGDKDIEL